MVSPHFAVARLFNDLGIIQDDLKHLDRIVFARGGIIQYERLHGAEARLTTLGRDAIITISTAIKDERRQRFSIAHELGHLEMHRHTREVFMCTNQDISDRLTQTPNDTLEHEANEFAATLLLPEQFFAPLCDEAEPSLDFVARLAKEFEVSVTATAIRYLKFCSEPCALVFTQDAYIKWFQTSKSFDEIDLFIDVKSKVDSKTLISRLFSNKSYLHHTTPQRIRASAWFSGRNVRQDATVLEQSWFIASRNVALTLLWIDDDIEEDDYYYHRGIL